MLKKLRLTAAILCLAGFCLLFVDVSGALAPRLAFLAKMQLGPAILSGSLIVIPGIFAATILFGRLYCSTLCPLGILQDAVSRLGKRRFGHAPAKTALRLGTLALFVLAFFAGIPLVFGLLEPYSAFGRIATDVLAPLWQAGSNLLALASERAENFAVGPTPVWQKGAPALAAALATIAVVGTPAIRSGRSWCNCLCPVGTILGFLARFALLKPRINAERCVHCGLCAQQCKAACIDDKQGEVDASRCVACFNCLQACKNGAIRYGLPLGGNKKKIDPGRRDFLASLSFGAVAPHTLRRDMAAEEKIPALARKTPPPRAVPIAPPGARSLRSFQQRCTGCQLCVAACPNQVLKASGGAMTLMLQPSLSFERGYCRVNCVTCSSVCPTGAIAPISGAEKSVTQLGRAILDRSLCINETTKERCNACARNCPPGALNLIAQSDGALRLAIDAERCTGCGACEYVCPTRPRAAIWVEGNLEQRRV
ncbi:MAG: 4Fe-4S dicluster domain-containing protein [Desulfovibrio sp.]|jgi:ferredoxin|nr:4Fe-4S dicluster domain-containing protein [Desulfovibrio sp.]